MWIFVKLGNCLPFSLTHSHKTKKYYFCIFLRFTMQNKSTLNMTEEVPTLSVEASNRIMSADYNFAALLNSMENTDDQSTVVNLHNYTSYNVSYKISKFELEIEQKDVVIGNLIFTEHAFSKNVYSLFLETESIFYFAYRLF